MSGDYPPTYADEATARIPSEELPIPDDDIRAELNRILESVEFRASRRCQDFLKYVVEHALSRSTHGIKERTIGIEAFGRPATYDTNADGVVRIKASEVRKRLALYYAGSGKNSELHFILPVGNYVPKFSRTPHVGSNTSLATVLVEPNSIPPSGYTSSIPASLYPPPFAIWKKVAFWALLLSVVATLVGWSIARMHPRSELDQFWQPVLTSAAPILVATAYAPVYLPPPNSATGTFTLLNDQYVGGGDLVAAVMVSSMLTRMAHPYALRMGTAVSFDDLRNTPTVLIGYSSTQWASVTKSFRFFIDDGDLGMIRDNGQPTEWYPHNRGQDYHTNEDYAIISRAFDPQTHSMLVLITGCTQYGTEAAGRLVSNSELLSAALRGAPKGWQTKNLQLVLHIDIIANSPASTKVIASHYW